MLRQPVCYSRCCCCRPQKQQAQQQQLHFRPNKLSHHTHTTLCTTHDNHLTPASAVACNRSAKADRGPDVWRRRERDVNVIIREPVPCLCPSLGEYRIRLLTDCLTTETSDESDHNILSVSRRPVPRPVSIWPRPAVSRSCDPMQRLPLSMLMRLQPLPSI